MKKSKLPIVVLLGVLAFFYVPIVVLVVNSFNESRLGGTWGGFTLKWYGKLFSDSELWEAAVNTLLVATSATAVSVVVGTLAGFALHRYKSALQQLHFGLVYIPLVLPDILMGMSLLLLFVSVGIPLGLTTVFLAHVTFCISYVAMIVLARFEEFDFSLIDAARDLGATGWTLLWRLYIPLLGPGIVAGGLLAFTLSIDDFVVSFFVAGPGATTLPIRIYSLIKHGSPPVINALSTLLLTITFAAVFASQKFGNRVDNPKSSL